jgi:hypothetical protein
MKVEERAEMRKYIVLLLIVTGTVVISQLQTLVTVQAQTQKKPCYTKQSSAAARHAARVYMRPDPDYDPVLGYPRSKGPRPGSPPVDENGLALPIKCVAAEKKTTSGGTTPKFYCTVEGNVDDNGKAVVYKVKPNFKGDSREKRNGEIQGEFLSSRFSKAMGFFADDEWVADVTCPDCEKSLTKPFQGAKFAPFQPASGIELQLAEGIESDCETDSEYSDLSSSLGALDASGRSDETSAEIDAFKLWLAFIDHGDTKKQNQKFACLSVSDANGTVTCAEPIYYVSDMGSTFGYSTASENKARLEQWRKKDPIRMDDGKCYANAKSVGDTHIDEAGRKLLADNLQRLLDEEASDHVITRVFAASRNAERDQPPAAWTTEFVRKAQMIINAHCTR